MRAFAALLVQSNSTQDTRAHDDIDDMLPYHA